MSLLSAEHLSTLDEMFSNVTANIPRVNQKKQVVDYRPAGLPATVEPEYNSLMQFSAGLFSGETTVESISSLDALRNINVML